MLNYRTGGGGVLGLGILPSLRCRGLDVRVEILG